MKIWTYFIATFGCKVNQYESRAIAEAWSAFGGTESAVPAGVDIALINSCAVTAKAERDARNAVYRLRREAPQARILLTGCSARLAGAALEGADRPWAVIPQERKSLLLSNPWEAFPPGDDPLPAPPLFPPFALNGYGRARPVLKVQDGCSHRCAYCIVPLTRGPARSRDPEEVRAEAERLAAAGFRELVISGINLSQYRLPEARNFTALLRVLEDRLAPRWAGRLRLRVSSLEPSQLDEDFVELFGRSRLLCPHLHLSLQSGSPDVLRRMGRGHTDLEHLEKSVRLLRSARSPLGLGADLLTGFPGESETDFSDSLNIISGLGLTYAHVFPYSRRPGTPAATMPGQIAQAEKARRARLLREAVAARRADFLRGLLALPSLFMIPEGARNCGIDEHYAPCRLAGGSPPPGRELLPVRPLRVDGDKILVERA